MGVVEDDGAGKLLDESGTGCVLDGRGDIACVLDNGGESCWLAEGIEDADFPGLFASRRKWRRENEVDCISWEVIASQPFKTASKSGRMGRSKRKRYSRAPRKGHSAWSMQERNSRETCTGTAVR